MGRTNKKAAVSQNLSAMQSEYNNNVQEFARKHKISPADTFIVGICMEELSNQFFSRVQSKRLAELFGKYGLPFGRANVGNGYLVTVEA